MSDVLSPRSKARQLRRDATEAERALWQEIRRRQLRGYRFRRQHPIGEYIVDFFCHEKGLVVEVDGGQHAERKEYDLIRTKYFESQGYQVKRFWNSQIFGEMVAVKQVILEALEARQG